GHVGRVVAAFVAGGEHHQAVVVADEETVLVGDGGGHAGAGPVQAAPGVVHDPHARGDQVLVDAADAQRAGHLVALPGAVIVRSFVVDDARRQDARARRHATGPALHRCTGGQQRHRGAVADHIVDGGVVGPRVDIGE